MKMGLFFILISVGFIFADLPKFEDNGLINAAGTPIDLRWSSPCVYDWDGDGKKDLIVGQFSGGRIHLYLNIGTNSSPVLAAATFLKADGVVISLPAA